MTNSEMATYIAKRHDEDRPVDTSRKAAALEAMAWKDEQFAAEKQAFIDKACEWLKDNFETQSEIVGYSPARGRVRYCVSKDFIVVSEMIDIFRKSMEETK